MAQTVLRLAYPTIERPREGKLLCLVCGSLPLVLSLWHANLRPVLPFRELRVKHQLTEVKSESAEVLLSRISRWEQFESHSQPAFAENNPGLDDYPLRVFGHSLDCVGADGTGVSSRLARTDIAGGEHGRRS